MSIENKVGALKLAAERAEKQLSTIEKELKDARIAMEESGITCIVNGAGTIIDLTISPHAHSSLDNVRLAKLIKQVIAKAMLDASRIASEKMGAVQRIVESVKMA